MSGNPFEALNVLERQEKHRQAMERQKKLKEHKSAKPKQPLQQQKRHKVPLQSQQQLQRPLKGCTDPIHTEQEEWEDWSSLLVSQVEEEWQTVPFKTKGGHSQLQVECML
jgi:hypothetical protein